MSARIVIITRAADGGSAFVSKRSTPSKVAVTRDRADVLAWDSLGPLLGWLDRQSTETRDALRDRGVTAASVPAGLMPDLDLVIPAPNFDAGWSPTTHPIDVSLCVGGKPSKPAAKVATGKAKSVFA